MVKIKLSKPINYEGEQINELELDLDSLEGRDFIEAEREVGSSEFTPMKEFSKAHLAILAARACGRPSDLIPLLGIKDFSKVTVEVQNFLFNEE